MMPRIRRTKRPSQSLKTLGNLFQPPPLPVALALGDGELERRRYIVYGAIYRVCHLEGRGAAGDK